MASLYLTADSVAALQEAVEGYLVRLFEDTTLCANDVGKVTIMPKGVQVAACTHGKRN